MSEGDVGVLPVSASRRSQLHHLVEGVGRLIAKSSADPGGKGLVDVEKGVSLKSLRKHANLLEVDHANSALRIDEELSISQ